MTLGIVQTIWGAFSDLVSSILTIDHIFYIGVGFLLLMALFSFIKARTSYEYKLDKTVNVLSNWLYRHQTITEQNLVEFNNIIKDKKSPKILRKYWQQYMLYRDKAPSEYMSTYNCIDKPLKTSGFTSSIKNFSMIYRVTAIITFFLSMFCFANRTDTVFTYLTQSMIASIAILFLGVVLTLALRAMQNYNIAALYQSFNLFCRYIDKASVTIPKYVDFEILFTKQEISEGIPILGEYLEKRARQEQEELEEAQRNAVSHEEYNFSESGIDGSLVLERAMKESETYINIKQRLLTEIQQFESEISTLKKNYENTSKDYQRKLQTSKENLERLRQQQEESTNRIEVNYIRKQQQDEVKKQEQLEKDQEDATNKFNIEVNSLSEEIEKRRQELENKKLAVQSAMQSEYQTFSSKLHKSIAETVEKSKNESIQEISNKNEQYAQAITYLKNEVDSRDELIKSKDQTIAELATKLQDFLGKKYAEEQQKEDSVEQVDNVAQEEPQTEEIVEETTEEATEGHYDSRGYYWFNNGTYYDDQNLYHDLEGNVMDSDGNLIRTGAVVEKEGEIAQQPIVEETLQNTTTQVQEEQPAEAEEQEVEEQVQEENVEQSIQTENLQPEDQVTQQPEETTEDKPNEPVDGKLDLSGNFTYSDGTYYDKDNLYHSEDGKVYNTEGKQIEQVEEQNQPSEDNVQPVEEQQKVVEQATEQVGEEPKVEQTSEPVEDNTQEEAPKRKAGRPRKERPAEEEQPKRRVGRPKKEVSEDVEEQPKRKAGRPKKVVDTQEEEKPKRKAGRPKKEKTEEELNKPKRKAGRPKKEVSEDVEEQPKRKAGRPKKVVDTQEEEKPKRKAGRPKKEKTEEELNKPKRKAGRPKKQTTESDQSTKLLQQLGQSLINITSQENND